VSVCGFTAAGCLYFYAVIPAWCCIIIAALSASTAHIIEHDLIHQQYFKSTSAVYHFMIFMVWIIRPNTVNPYYRKGMHLNHHRTSGTPQDIEGCLLGNRIKSHALRLLVVCDGLLGLIIRCKQLSRDISGYHFLMYLMPAFFLSLFIILLFIVFYFSIASTLLLIIKQ
jgi:fatty acid desaturase